MRPLALAFLTLLTLAPAHAQDLSVTGSAQATWTSPQILTSSPDSIVRSGHAITVTVTGKVDINQQARNRRDCSLFGLDCHWVNWTEHHWTPTPDAAPVLVQVRGLNGGDVIASATVGAGSAVIQLPTNNADLQRKYEVVAILAGVGSAIDPNRSAGAYTVKLNIDARARTLALPNWLADIKPTAEVATSPDVLDQALTAGHGVEVATALRTYAAQRFPLAQTALRSSHEKLLRKALELAPDDPANALALATYFRAVGLNADADNLLNKVINDLQGKTDAKSRRTLGQAYVARADATLSLSGSINPASTQEAIVYLGRAIEAFGDSGRRDLVVDALVRRGRLLRGLRTQDGLESAIVSMRRAYDLVPAMVKARAASESPDGAKLQVLDWTEGYAKPLIGASADTLPAVEDAVALKWDPDLQQVLELRNGAFLQWRGLAPGATPTSGPLLPKSPWSIEARHGSVLWTGGKGEAIFASPDGTLTDLTFGAQSACPQQQGQTLPGMPLPPPAPAFLTGSIGPGGDLLATYCNNTLRIYRTGGGAPAQPSVTVAIAPSGLNGFGRLNLVAGPAACGVAVAYVDASLAAPPTTTLVLIRPDGTQQPINLPAPPSAQPSYGLSFGMGFSRDGRLLVSRADGPVLTYRCADGAALATIPLPPATSAGQQMPFLPPPDWLFISLDADRFVVSDLSRRRVVLIDTAHNTAEAFETGPNDLQGRSVIPTLLPPAKPGDPPRQVQMQFRSQLRGLSEESAMVGAGPNLPADASVRLLNGGRYMLVTTAFSAPTLADLSDARTTLLNELLAPVPIEAANGWAAIRTVDTPVQVQPFTFVPRYRPKAIETYAGSAVASTTSLPDFTAAQRANMVTALKTVFDSPFHGGLAAPPLPGIPPPPFLPPEEFAAVVADPSRMEQIYSLGLVISPLASSGAAGAHLLCPMIYARAPSGDMKPLPDFFLAITAQIPPPLLVTYRGGRPTFTPVADKRSCDGLVVIDGPVPIVLADEGNGQQHRLRWLRNGAWVDAGLKSGDGVPAMGSVMPDGSVLLLMTNAPGAPANHTLLRLPPGGGQQNACAHCASLPLMDAAKALWQRSQDDPTARTDTPFAPMDPQKVIMVDAAGRLLVRPDGDETVIESLHTGAELLRVRLSGPLVLRPSLVVLDSGDAKLQVHQLTPP